jgi:hypothetical protein
MDLTQKQHELAVGTAFIEWYNRQNDTAYRYHSRGADPPDLVYRSGDHEILLEITAAYYDADNAAMLWQNARGVASATDIWISKDPDQKLIDSINTGLIKKCAKSYPAHCVLILHIYPDLMSAEELDALLHQIKIPADHSFAGIYLTGMFPTSSGGSRSGYSCWKLA